MGKFSFAVEYFYFYFINFFGKVIMSFAAKQVAQLKGLEFSKLTPRSECHCGVIFLKEGKENDCYLEEECRRAKG